MASRTSWLGSAALVLSLTLVGCGSAQNSGIRELVQARVASPRNEKPIREDYQRYYERIDSAMQRELALFYPATVDQERGGFTHALPADWAKMDAKARQKGIVYQSRMTWTAAEVARMRPEMREQYLPYVQHGLAFLRDRMWDGEQGGFFWVVGDDGAMVPEQTDKSLYGEAFGMYAAASVYLATKDDSALELAMRTFNWLEEHAHDQKNGGYFEAFTRAGEPILDASKSFDASNPNDVIGTPYGFKSMNAHIHLMEALTTLAIARPEDRNVRKRLDEVFLIVRDKIAVKPGCMNLYFTADWKALPTADSYGHNVETAFLLYEGDTVRHGAPNSKTRMVAKMLVDQPLQAGWDNVMGGFFYEGVAFGKPHVKDKHWWVQAEGLNALLMMHEVYGGGDLKYWKAFCEQWEFIQQMQIDPNTGGWYSAISPGGEVQNQSLLNPWKANYHTVRAGLNVTERLRRLGAEAIYPGE